MTACAVLAVLALSVSVSSAQSDSATGASQPTERQSFWRIFPAIGSDFASLVSVDSAWTLSVGGVAGAAAHGQDESVRRALNQSTWVDTAFTPDSVGVLITHVSGGNTP